MVTRVKTRVSEDLNSLVGHRVTRVEVRQQADHMESVTLFFADGRNVTFVSEGDAYTTDLFLRCLWRTGDSYNRSF